jgi:GntR family transcriptional regulator
MTSSAQSANKVLNYSAVARYLQLAALFRRRIETGVWPVDERIPTVDELAKECGVASMTIRQAMDILQSEGLIERFRAKGTFVRKRNRQDLWCDVQTDWNGLLLARADAEIEVLHSEDNVVPADVPMDVGARASSYRHLRRLHRRSGQAFLVADVYVDEKICPLIPEAHFSSKTALRLVAELPGVKIVDARQILTIGMADPETSQLLSMPLNDPVARVQRIAVDFEGTMVLVANGIYRGDMVRIDMKLLK